MKSEGVLALSQWVTSPTKHVNYLRASPLTWVALEFFDLLNQTKLICGELAPVPMTELYLANAI